MNRLKTPFDCDEVRRECHVTNRVNIAWEPSEKGPHKIVPHGRFSGKIPSGKMDYDVI